MSKQAWFVLFGFVCKNGFINAFTIMTLASYAVQMATSGVRLFVLFPRDNPENRGIVGFSNLNFNYFDALVS